MVVVGVSEDAVDSPGHGTQSLHRGFFDVESAGEVFVAVEQGGRPVEGVQGVV